MLALEDVMHEEYIALERKRPSAIAHVEPQDDHWPISTTSTHTYRKGRPRVLILGDSFTVQLLPFFSEDADSVTWALLKIHGLSRSLIAREGADAVVVVVVERLLPLLATIPTWSTAPSKSLRRKRKR